MSKFKVGMVGVKTRSGRDARIVCTTAGEPFPIVAIVDGLSHSFLEDGLLHRNNERGLDLILPELLQEDV
jgi:hypothetical protein